MKTILQIIIVAGLLAIVSSAKAGTADGTFTAPTQRTDGSALPQSQIGGYNVYVDGVLDSISPLPSDATSFTLALSPGIHKVIMTTFDNTSTPPQVSIDSNEVIVNIPFSAPNAPVLDVTFTISK